ncbi:helix-turn-helix domain-containing protein [Qipengyuania sp. MTN3-11]|uniref:helix-turn-helix domain-containing protein n=1 Tax=Qipengyuania sp. MTN3-11 TaxID=3056557 RepID=UPI0036F1F509
MEEDVIVEDAPAPPAGAGERLKAAREARGLEIAQVAAETRIPERHLLSIENGDFDRLPSRTYAIGFTRTYARLLELDEKELLDAVRAELAASNPERRASPAKFEPGDPARVPSRGLAWLSAAAVVLLLVGGFSFYRSYFAPGMGPAPLTDDRQQAARDADERRPEQRQAAAAVPSGPVVFTSEMDGTWVKFYDAGGERLYEAQMDAGDSFTVPADAEGPQVWTGRPYALAITVGGRSVPKLSEEDEIVRDVPVTAEALLERGSAPSANPAPAASAPGTGDA